jgi:hypothetical protein
MWRQSAYLAKFDQVVAGKVRWGAKGAVAVDNRAYCGGQDALAE